MATAEDLRSMALALTGTFAYPHFDRTAFKVQRTFVTLAPDGLTANFKFTPDEQELKCLLASEIFAPVPGGWGRQGWTCATLAPMTQADLSSAVDVAYAHALPKPKTRRR